MLWKWNKNVKCIMPTMIALPLLVFRVSQHDTPYYLSLLYPYLLPGEIDKMSIYSSPFIFISTAKILWCKRIFSSGPITSWHLMQELPLWVALQRSSEPAWSFCPWVSSACGPNTDTLYKIHSLYMQTQFVNCIWIPTLHKPWVSNTVPSYLFQALDFHL